MWALTVLIVEGKYVPVAPYNSGPGWILLRRHDKN